MHVQSCRFALSSYCFFYFLVAASSWTSYYLRYIVIRQKHNFFSANRLLLIASETFFDSSVVPSFLIIGKLGERTGQLWRDNSRRVWTHEKNSGDAVRRLGTIIQSIFCAQSGASIRLTVWKWSGESRYPGALPPMLENVRRTFSRPTDCPWVSEDGFRRDIIPLSRQEGNDSAIHELRFNRMKWVTFD